MPGCDNGKSSGDKMCKSCDTAASGHGSNLSARRATADPMASNPFVGGGGAPDRRNPMLGTRHKSAPAPTGKKKTRTPNKPANKPAPAPDSHPQPTRKGWSSEMWFASKEQCALDETYSVEYTWSDKIEPSEPSKGSSYHYTWELSYVNSTSDIQ